MRAVTKRVVAASLMCATPGAGAAAQADLPLPDHDAEAMIAKYADCVVAKKSRRQAVDLFVRTVPNTEASYRASLKAADMTCLDAAASRARSVIRMRMQPGMFRDALYPALYRRDFAGGAPAVDYGLLAARDLATEYDGTVAGLPADYATRRTLGDCVSRSSPRAASDFLKAVPWSDADTASVDQLKPALGQCLAPGQTARFNRAALRAIVGESMYKLARTATARS